MAVEPLECRFGQFTLRRYPLQREERLRAWDGADAYLLDRLPDPEGRRILIFNDNFGALGCALARFEPTLVSDSHIAAWSTRENLGNNGLETTRVEFLGSLDPLKGKYDLVLVRVPRTLALLEHQLISLRPHLHGESQVIGAGMTRQIHNSTLELFEKLLGATRTSLARRKARLIHPVFDPGLPVRDSPYPVCYPLEGSDHTLCSHANVFSRERLDRGTRLLLPLLPSDGRFRQIVDLGCGNGLLGLMAAERNPRAAVQFLDESHMAVASARLNFSAWGLANRADFRVGDALDGVAAESVELILCNPPFHQQQVVGDAIAWRMFSQSRTALKPGGELWVVGNRHLNYHAKLKRLFGNREQMGQDNKFVVLKSRRER